MTQSTANPTNTSRETIPKPDAKRETDGKTKYLLPATVADTDVLTARYAAIEASFTEACDRMACGVVPVARTTIPDLMTLPPAEAIKLVGLKICPSCLLAARTAFADIVALLDELQTEYDKAPHGKPPTS